jgi:hypothetical protein
MWRVAGPDVPGDPGPRVTVEETPSESYGSGSALAAAFGGTILEPSWWPADTEEISYSLNGRPGHPHFFIGSTRAGGEPVCVVGFFEAAWAGRSPRDWLNGEWTQSRELVHVRGLIGWVGIPSRLQVVIYDKRLAIQLVGYHTEDEIMGAVKSLRHIEPD